MKINTEHKLREIAGESVVVQQGKVGSDLTKIISLNSSAKYLYETFVGKEFTVEDVAAALVDHYGIDTERAAQDAAKWVDALVSCTVIVK